MIVEIEGVGKIDLNKLAKLLPGRKSWDIINMTTQGRYMVAIVKSWQVLQDYEINTPLRIGHFLGQGLIETGWLRYRRESLNYSAEALQATFSKYRGNPELAAQHARKQELIANTVYGGRLGNTEPGDGWKFRGRGFIQLTGRDNYTRYGAAAGLDLVNDPDLIATDLKKSVHVAAAFWKENGLNTYADQNDAAKVSRGVNRGNPNSNKRANHEDERILWTRTALSITQAPEEFQPDPATAKTLQTGSRGDDVRKLQTELEALGYTTGGVDGIFGKGTRRAVVAFQEENALPVTGVADQATLAEIQTELDEMSHIDLNV